MKNGNCDLGPLIDGTLNGKLKLVPKQKQKAAVTILQADMLALHRFGQQQGGADILQLFGWNADAGILDGDDVTILFSGAAQIKFSALQIGKQAVFDRIFHQRLY